MRLETDDKKPQAQKHLPHTHDTPPTPTTHTHQILESFRDFDGKVDLAELAYSSDSSSLSRSFIFKTN